jgi:hypothetical protein
MVDQAKQLVQGATARERQLSLIDPVSTEEMVRARDELGSEAGHLAVLDHARAKRGRKPGSRNRHNADFKRYILQFGRDPAITLMELSSADPEVLVMRSKQLDPVKRQMTLQEARSLVTRAAEALMPYIHGKVPVRVDLTAEGDFNLIIPGVNVPTEDAKAAAAGTFVPYTDFEEVDDGEGRAE